MIMRERRARRAILIAIAVILIASLAFLNLRKRQQAPPEAKPLTVLNGFSPPKRQLAQWPAASPSPISSVNPVDPDEAQFRASLSTVSEEVGPLIALVTRMKPFYDRIRAEGRDKAWATRSEAMLRNEYAKMEGTDKGHRPIAINCGTTLCEISGDNADPAGGLNDKQMSHIQAAEFSANMWRQGYHGMGTAFGPGRTGAVFVSYFQREAPIDVQVEPLEPTKSQPSSGK